MARAKPKIWVMEGKWASSVMDVRTVSPMMAALDNANVATSTLHHINTVEDLQRSLVRWGQRQHAGHGIGYLALHGAPGSVFVGRRRVDLGILSESLPKNALKGKVLHFGSCAVLDLKPKEREVLRAALGVRGITGFTEDVEWFESMAFELMLLESLAYYKRLDAVERDLKERAGGLWRRLGFQMVRARST